MKPWESDKTIEQFRRMSGAQTAELACDLIDASLEILEASIREVNPGIGRKALHREMIRILWELNP